MVLDASLRQSLVTVRSLGRAGVLVHAYEAGASAPAFASRYCSGSAVLPSIAEAPDAFADAVLEHARGLTEPVIFASHDGAIDVLCARRPEVNRVGRLALAGNEPLAIAADKRRTLAVAAELGIPVPASITVTDRAMLAGAVAEVGLPAVLKPVRSWVDDGAIRRRVGSSVHRSHQDLAAAAELLLDLQSAVIVQSWLSGERQAVSLVRADGEIVAAFAQVAYRADPLLGGVSVMRESIPLPRDLAPAAESLVHAIGLEGYSEVEFRRDDRGVGRLMEINARLSASVEVAVRSGVDFPRLLYQWARGEHCARVRGYRTGVRMRWLGGDLRWLAKTIVQRAEPDAVRPAAAVTAFVRDSILPSHYDYFEFRDPVPAMFAVGGFLKRLYSHGVRYATAR